MKASALATLGIICLINTSQCLPTQDRYGNEVDNKMESVIDRISSEIVPRIGNTGENVDELFERAKDRVLRQIGDSSEIGQALRNRLNNFLPIFNEIFSCYNHSVHDFAVSIQRILEINDLRALNGQELNRIQQQAVQKFDSNTASMSKQIQRHFRDKLNGVFSHFIPMLIQSLQSYQSSLIDYSSSMEKRLNGAEYLDKLELNQIHLDAKKKCINEFQDVRTIDDLAKISLRPNLEKAIDKVYPRFIEQNKRNHTQFIQNKMPDILAKIKAQFLERIENSDSELTWKTLQNWFTLETDDAIEKMKQESDDEKTIMETRNRITESLYDFRARVNVAFGAFSKCLQRYSDSMLNLLSQTGPTSETNLKKSHEKYREAAINQLNINDGRLQAAFKGKLITDISEKFNNYQMHGNAKVFQTKPIHSIDAASEEPYQREMPPEYNGTARDPVIQTADALDSMKTDDSSNWNKTKALRRTNASISNECSFIVIVSAALICLVAKIHF